MVKRAAFIGGIVCVISLAAFVGASGALGKADAQIPVAKSMEQLHSEAGLPVRVRELADEDFSVYLKYPTVLDSLSESTAYSTLTDVVRKVAVKAGDKVERGDVIVSFSENNKNYQSAKLSYDNALAAYNRAKIIYASSAISYSDFDNIKMQYKLAEASFEAAHDMIFVKAPIAGTIIQMDVRVSENVNAGTPLFTISNQSGLVARFYVGIEEIDRIEKGARVFVCGAENKLLGSVTDVSLSMDSKKHAFPVTATFDTTPYTIVDKIISGVSVDIAVETYRNKNALVLKSNELVHTGRGYAAFVAVDNVAKRVDIETGAVRSLEYEIISGLKKGDLLICDDVPGLTNNEYINIVSNLELAVR
jgi:RND family efflux transporter MFP subunit